MVNDFLANNNVTILGNPQHSPDLATAYFYLFTQLKPALETRVFCDATDLIKNATEELKRLSQNGFQDCLRHIYSLWQKCRVAKWNYLEGNVAYIIVPF